MCSSFIKQDLENAAVVKILCGSRNWIIISGGVSTSAQPSSEQEENYVS